MERRRRLKRRQRLYTIIQQILDGKIDASKTPLSAIFNQAGPRQTYISPQDRAAYDYGYRQNKADLPFFGEEK